MAGSIGFSFSTTLCFSSSSTTTSSTSKLPDILVSFALGNTTTTFALPTFGFPTASSTSPVGFGSSSSGFGVVFGFGSSASTSTHACGFTSFATAYLSRAFSFGGVSSAPSSTGGVRPSFGSESGSFTPTLTLTPAVTTCITTNFATIAQLVKHRGYIQWSQEPRLLPRSPLMTHSIRTLLLH